MNDLAVEKPPWYRSTLAVALVGSLLLWAALPPLAIGWIGWLAPVPWLLLVRCEQLPGRRPYLALYLAGLAFWLAAIHWLRLPHPAVYAGWLALSVYLACYLPVFVGLSRVAVHRLRVPLWLAAPVVWTGLELARAHLLTGFLMGSLAHTQVRWTTLIQVSDLFGEYGVDFLVMLVAACGAAVLRISDFGLRIGHHNPQFAIRNPPSIVLAILPTAIALAAALGYGHWRLSDVQRPADLPPRVVRIALIQGNSLADWKADLNKQRQIMEEYVGLSREAVTKARETGDGRPPDLVVWPETMFRTRLIRFAAGFRPPPDLLRTPEEIAAAAPSDLAALVARLDAPVLVGIDRIHYEGSRFRDQGTGTNDALNPEPPTPNPSFRAYNSAVLVDRSGRIVGSYDKVHLVMFGEYVPFARWLPFLDRLSSLTGSVEPGEGPVALCVDNICYAPNICYETAIPHVIRRQVTTLNDRSEFPDVLVNLTNDAWYWGSSELDMHLACDVFRAIETRRPLVIAANGGISAWIDHTGRIRARSPRQKKDVIIADVELVVETSWYVELGDWFAGACLACCVVLAVVGVFGRRRSV